MRMEFEGFWIDFARRRVVVASYNPDDEDKKQPKDEKYIAARHYKLLKL